MIRSTLAYGFGPIWQMILCVLAFACSASACAGQLKVTADEIGQQSVVVVGNLGLPLGTPTEVEGILVPIKDPMANSSESFHLVVEIVGGQQLQKSKTFSFRVERELWSLMARTEPELRTLLDGYVRGDSGTKLKITRAQADQYLRDYTKSRRKLTVYESGRFVGRPYNLPPATSKAPDFKFETFLVVVEPERPFVQEILEAHASANK